MCVTSWYSVLAQYILMIEDTQCTLTTEDTQLFIVVAIFRKHFRNNALGAILPIVRQVQYMQ